MPNLVAIISVDKGQFKWGEVDSGVKFYSCSHPQLEILASTTKYTSAFAGTGGGKTCLGALWIFKQLSKFRETDKQSLWRCLVVSPTYPIFESSQLKMHIQSVFQDTLFQGEWNGQTKTYHGDNFEVVCKSADNDPTSLTGGQYNAILVDEAWAISNPEVWEEIRRRSNILNAPILVVTTPNVNGWIYDELYIPWQNKDPEYHVVQWATSQNPVKTPEEHAKFLDAELKKLGPEKFNRMYGGQFTSLTGLVYNCFADPKSPNYPVIPTPDILPSPAVRCFMGQDWGWSDPNATLVLVECENDIIYVVEEFYGTQIPIDHVGNKIKELINKWSIKWGSKYGDILQGGFFDSVYCDASRPEATEMVRRFGVPIKNKKISNIEASIAITDTMFRIGRLKVFDCCTNLIREAKQYDYDKNGKINKRPDHVLDSLRYSISSYMDGKEIAIIPQAAPRTKEQIEQEEHDKAKRLHHVHSADDLAMLEQMAWEKKQREWAIQMEHMECDCEDNQF